MSRSTESRARRALHILWVSLTMAACADAPLEAAPSAPVEEFLPSSPTESEVEAALAAAEEEEGALAHTELSLTRCEDLDNQCFGAVGSRCGGTPSSWSIEVPPLVQLGCKGDRCWTNAGSWEHDECCAVYPRGHWCGDLTTLASTDCKAAWDRAVHRVTHGLSWRREVDRCRVDDDGLVDFAEYCAPPGVIVATDDTASCCSRRARALNIFFDFFRIARQRVLVDDSFRPVVCQ